MTTDRHTYFCIDAHTCGNPVRVVTGGGPILPAAMPMADKRKLFLERHDAVRTALMFEPRGHDQMSGAILYAPSSDVFDIGVLFIETSGCLPMCGHGAIGTVTVMIEHGLVTPRTPGLVVLETPAGRVEARYTLEGGRVTRVELANVPAYLHAADVTVDVPGLGRVTFDLAYGGNYYCIVEPQAAYPGLDGFTAGDLVRHGRALREAARAALSPVHPEDSRIGGVSHVMWCDRPKHPRAHARNAVLYGDKAIDRSPCGTGSSARMAQLHAKGRLAIGAPFVHESVIGTLFDCRLSAETRLGDRPAVMPHVAGWAKVTGLNTIFVDVDDPLAAGFQLI